MALGRLTSFTFGNSFLTLVYANSQTYYVSYAHIIAGESDSRSGDLTIWIYTAGEVGETLSVKNSDLVAIGSSATAFLALFNQNIQPYSYWQDFLDSTTASGALPSEPSALRGQCLYARFRPIYNFGSASLINVPARFKAGTLYSQVPDTGAGDFTVTRATTPVGGRSTRINKDGLIELVADNVPRLDYPLGGAVNGCPALLVEPAATNLVLQSQAFDVTWFPLINGTGVNPAITANAAISPDGTQNAERIVFNRGAGNSSADQSTLQQNITIPTTGAYILSVYAKASTAGDVGKQIFIRIGGAGTLTPITLTANWVRYSRAETSVASGSQAVQIGNRGTFTADNSVSVDLWGAQAEGGAIPTSYIPTTTAAVTRSADVISRTSATALIGQTEGTFYLDLTVLSKGSSSAARWLQIFGASNNIGLAMNSSNQFRSIVNAQSDTLLTAPLISSGVKVAWAYDGTGTTCFINGTQYTLTNGGNQTMSSLTSLTISGSDNSQLANARIRAAALYTTRLTNAQLAFITQP